MPLLALGEPVTVSDTTPPALDGYYISVPSQRNADMAYDFVQWLQAEVESTAKQYSSFENT